MPRSTGSTGSTDRSERPGRRDRRREVPSVDALLRSPAGRKAADRLGRPVLKLALQDVLDTVRADARRGGAIPPPEEILARGAGIAARDLFGLSEVINATGVILHTGLGRAPLARPAARAAAKAAHGYSDLEVDRETGQRGRRTNRVERLLLSLTGAEAALAVNNGAAALLLTLSALAARKEVLVSRGELIEIGGEFRLPDIMAASGARLVEVGTTNRTRAADYRRAITPKTALILRVHQSNYRVIGFTDAASLAELSAIASKATIPLVHDVGSGLLHRTGDIPPEEPSVVEGLAGGADLVVFSGDKLLGGPQAGLIVGARALVDRLRRHPMARAVRLDKMTIAALEATLRLHATGRRAEVPLWRSIEMPQRHIAKRARAMATSMRSDGLPASSRSSEAVVGGGSLPGYAIPSAELLVPTAEPNALAALLRTGQPAVFCKVGPAEVAFDLRTVPPEDDDRLTRAIRHALGSP
jgi:L-seryl-tRNA(Ser) seleniumtransferase